MLVALMMLGWATVAGCVSAAVVNDRAPQRPPYRIGALSVQVEGGTLEATMTMPEGSGPFAAVVLAGRDREESLKDWPAFDALVDALTRAGLIVVRPARDVVRPADVQALAVRLAEVPSVDRTRIGAMGLGASAATARDAMRGVQGPITFVVVVPVSGAPAPAERIFSAPLRYTPGTISELTAWIRALR